MRLPVFAVGGITPERVREVMRAGAAGVAVIGAILGADRPAEVVSEFLDRLGGALMPIPHKGDLMPTLDDVKRAVCEAIDRRSEEIVALGETIRKNPELGFKEFKTARLVEETFERAGPAAPRRAGDDRRARRGGGRRGRRARPSRCSASWTASSWPATRWPIRRPAPRTPAATTPRWRGCSARRWACSRPSAFEHLAGRVVFFAVPAEEYGDVEWRVAAGAGGAARVPRRQAGAAAPRPLRRRGHGDDDPHHARSPRTARRAVPASNNGCIVKTVRYIGRAVARGRGAAHGDQRALRRAASALAAINAIRETFRDEDTIRVHPIITHGG